MTRSIQWIADSGLLVGLTTIGEFALLPALVELSLSSSSFALTVPESAPILGVSQGSNVTATDLPAGFTISPAPALAYDGSGTVGSYAILLTETLSGAGNSPLTTSVAVTVSAPVATGAGLDFSQSVNSGLIAAMRSF